MSLTLDLALLFLLKILHERSVCLDCWSAVCPLPFVPEAISLPVLARVVSGHQV